MSETTGSEVLQRRCQRAHKGGLPMIAGELAASASVRS